MTDALGTDFPVTKLLVGLCMLVFTLSVLGKGPFPILSDAIAYSEFLKWGGLAYYDPALGVVSTGRAEPWRFLAAVFVHFNAVHVAFNTLALLDLGRPIETEIRWPRFTILFVTAGVVGFLVSDLWYVHQGVPARTAGASGAVFGLLGALAGEAIARRDRRYKLILARIVAYGVAAALLFSANNAAHLGGGLAGLCLGYLYHRQTRPWRLEGAFQALAIGLVLLSFASVLYSTRSGTVEVARSREERVLAP